MPKFHQYKALSFDCYGTLIDWESGIWDAFQPLILRNQATLTRHETLERFARIESGLQAENPAMTYPEVLKRTHIQFAADTGMETDTDLDSAFGDSVPMWPAFPDSADALRILASSFKLIILSNVNREGFAASGKKLGVKFDAIYTAEDIGSYKPNQANFDFMLKSLAPDTGISRENLLHVAQSLFHDIEPAKKSHLPTVWIDRQRLSEGGSWGATAKTKSMPEPDHKYFTLMDFALDAR